MLIAIAACGASPRGPIDDQALPPAPPLALEWKAAQADGDQVAITLVVDGRDEALQKDGDYFTGLVAATAGSRYGFRFDGDDRLYPDPVS